jgi:hypothetical protein
MEPGPQQSGKWFVLAGVLMVLIGGLVTLRLANPPAKSVKRSTVGYSSEGSIPHRDKPMVDTPISTLKARVQSCDGVPTLYINNKIYPPFAYISYLGKTKYYRQIAESGIHLYW